MKAAVMRAVHAPLEIEEIQINKPAARELLVRTVASGVCHSDLHVIDAALPVPLPTVLGHEILGRIVALPDDETVRDFRGDPLKIGDRITWATAASCGACFFCCRGVPQKCEHLFKYGHERLTDEHPLSGGLADYCHLTSGTAVFPVPVCAVPIRSEPASAGGMPSRWISVGWL